MGLPKFQFLFLLLVVLQVLMAMVGEAALCEAPSKLFNGACFRSSNCATICEKEGFLNGRCKMLKCICSKDCSGGGGGGGGGAQDPPEGPPPDDQGGNAGGDQGGDGGGETPNARLH